MTYVVHFWEEPAPASLEDAEQLHERLCDMPAPLNPKFALLTQALAKRFPAEVGGRGDAEECWVDSRFDGRNLTRVFSMGLYGEGIARLPPVLVTQATALGLTVYDEQAGRAYLPGGVVLDDAGRRTLHDVGAQATRVLSLAQAKARYRAIVEPALRAFRFPLQA